MRETLNQPPHIRIKINKYILITKVNIRRRFINGKVSVICHCYLKKGRMLQYCHSEPQVKNLTPRRPAYAQKF